jgi:hypothetical protein
MMIPTYLIAANDDVQMRMFMKAVFLPRGTAAQRSVRLVWRKELGSEMLVWCSLPTISLRGWSGCSQTLAADG